MEGTEGIVEGTENDELENEGLENGRNSGRNDGRIKRKE